MKIYRGRKLFAEGQAKGKFYELIFSLDEIQLFAGCFDKRQLKSGDVSGNVVAKLAGMADVCDKGRLISGGVSGNVDLIDGDMFAGSVVNKSLKLRHGRFGHLNGADVVKVIGREMVSGVDALVESSLEACIKGKKSRKPLSSEKHKVVIAGDVIFDERINGLELDDEELKNVHEVTVQDEHRSIVSNVDNLEVAAEPRKSDRVRIKPKWLKEYEMSTMNAESFVDEVPVDLEESKSISDWLKWKKAVDVGMKSLIKNDPWNLARLPEVRRDNGCKWLVKKFVEMMGLSV